MQAGPGGRVVFAFPFGATATESAAESRNSEGQNFSGVSLTETVESL